MSYKNLKELYGFEKSTSIQDLRKIILEEYRKVLKEQDEEETAEEVQENPEGFIVVNKMTNIKDLDLNDTWRQLTSRDEEAPLVQAMKTATGWAAGAFEKAGGVEGLADWAEGVGESELKSRIGDVAGSLPSGAPAKADMPALEGSDADEVQDALSPGGDITVDLSAPHADGEESFEAWYNSLSDEDKEKLSRGEKPEVKKESKFSLSQVLFEDKFPRYGNSAFPGAPSKGEGESIDLKAITDKALAFLLKGQLDGEQGDDTITVKVKGTLSNGKMIPTQSNILAGKSLLFAFLHGSPDSSTDLADMGGAYATTSGEILDGHHRWSGAAIATGGGLTHSNVNLVDGDADTLIPLLVSVGNALGRDQKGVEEEKNESINSKGNLILERWQKLADVKS